MRKLLAAVLVACCAFVPLAALAQTGVKRALLVGINNYAAVPRLQGSVNDVETMRQVLVSRWGFAERNITVLTDERATRAAIMAALDRLVKEAGPDDIVYFHFSGHGSQVKDLNGDEDDGLDETIIPQDGRVGDVRDIVDDELDEIFARLKARSVLIVLDSCHSGTATRSTDIRTRSVPQDTRIAIYEAYEKSKVSTRAVVPVMESHFVVFAGAADNQEALDGPVDGRFHGFFTYALARSMGNSPLNASAREVFRGVEQEMRKIQARINRSVMPEPQLEAPPELLDKPLFEPRSVQGAVAGSAPPARLPWVEARPQGPGRITLVNSLLLGGGPGSTWAIYPPADATFAPGAALAVATVAQTAGRDGLATLQPENAAIPNGARAVALLPAGSAQQIALRIVDVPAERRKSIEATLRGFLKDVEFVGANRPARFLVDVRGDLLRLLSADGMQVVASFPVNSQQWATGVAVVVSRSANATELLTLDNPSSQIKVDARVANAAPLQPTAGTRGFGTRGVTVVADTQPAQYRVRRAGEARTPQNSLQVEIRTSADAFITVVDVDSEGGVNLLFPSEHQRQGFYPDGLVRAGEMVALPDSLQSGNRAGFFWDYSPPKGNDTIRVFASTDLQTAQAIRQRVRTLGAPASRVGAGTRAVAAAVGDLRSTFRGLATRGIVTVQDPTSHVPTPSATPVYSYPAPPADAMQSNAAPPASQAPAMPSDWTATTLTV
ncbi:MAG TPA: caspase family protein, partial [Burkholderiales bacterium]|nr:caspase family protein [Burkholderiales bacterium]